MNILDFLDRVGQRRLEKYRIQPPRPRDTRMFVGVLFFFGYYMIVYAILRVAIPEANTPLVRDALLVLGPVIGAIGQSLFRTDVRDEIQTANTGEGFRALRSSAEATKAAAETLPPARGDGVGEAADEVASAAQERADEIKGEV